MNAREDKVGTDGTNTPVHPTTSMMQRQLKCARIMTITPLEIVIQETGLSGRVIQTCEGDAFLGVKFEAYTKLRDFYESMGVIFIDRGLKLAAVS